jgi:hypothetical protein
MKQRIVGPYKVKQIDGKFHVLREIAQGELQPLDPPVSFKIRQNAYRRAAQENLSWQARERIKKQAHEELHREMGENYPCDCGIL